MAATNKLRYSLAEDQHTANWETGADAEQEELPGAEFDEVADVEYELGADPDYDDIAQPEFDEAAQLDYEVEVADPDYDEVPVMVAVEQAAEPEPLAAPLPSGFAFELGGLALPLTQAQPHPVVWRGYLKERHPVTGLVQRVPVYQLADGYWDCYREEELRVA